MSLNKIKDWIIAKPAWYWFLMAAIAFATVNIFDKLATPTRDSFLEQCVDNNTTLNDCSEAWRKLQQEMEQTEQKGPYDDDAAEQVAENLQTGEASFLEILEAAGSIAMAMVVLGVMISLIRKIP